MLFATDAQRAVLSARAETRIDSERMENHQSMVNLMADRDRRDELKAAAEAHVSRWERNGLCWSGYVSAWRNLQAMPVDQMSRIILGLKGKCDFNFTCHKSFPSRVFISLK